MTSPTSSPNRHQGLRGDIAAAFMLLSRIPAFWHEFPADTKPDLIAAQWAFPLVGLVVGAVSGFILLAGQALTLPPLLSASLAIGSAILLTGGMHEDGLADMADGFGGGHDSESKARIMHDSHIGSYGVLALCLTTIARAGILAGLLGYVSGWQIVMCMAIAGAGSRFQVLALLRLFPLSPYARLATLTGKPDSVRGLIGMAIWLFPMLLFLPPIGVTAALVVTTAISLWVGRLACSQIGGLNGDVMGGAIVFGEISILACIFAAFGSGA